MTMAENDLDQGGNPGDTPDYQSTDQAADEGRLEAMIRESAEEKTARECSEPHPQPESFETAESNIAGGLMMLGAKAEEAGMKRTAEALSEKRCTVIAAHFIPVLEKFPIGQKLLAFLNSESGGPEAALFMACWPVISAARADMKELDRPPEKDINGDGVAGD